MDGSFEIPFRVAANTQSSFTVRLVNKHLLPSGCSNPVVYHHDGTAPEAPEIMFSAPKSPSNAPSRSVGGMAERGEDVVSQ